MVDRADFTAILLVVAGSIAAAIFLVFVPQAFSSNGSVLAAVAFVVITAPIYSYAAYWAFGVRHALAFRFYRRQAFGIGVIVLAIWSTNAISALSGLVSLQIYSALSNLTWYFLLFTLFYWIDASVLASRRSDPLLRDTFHWSKLRIPLWIVDLLAIGVTLSLLGYSEITGNVTLLNQVNAGTFNNAILNFLSGFPLVLAIVCGIIFLSAIAVRAKWNKTLRRHFAWFALFLIFLFGILGFNPAGPIVFVCAGFALYKSAKSLVPLNRIPSQELAPELMP
jgi:hypothetical protein